MSKSGRVGKSAKASASARKLARRGSTSSASSSSSLALQRSTADKRRFPTPPVPASASLHNPKAPRLARAESSGAAAKPNKKRYLILGHKDTAPYQHDKCLTNPPGTPVEGQFDVVLFPSMKNVQSQVFVLRKLRALAQDRARAQKKEKKSACEKAERQRRQQEEEERAELWEEQRRRIYALNAIMTQAESQVFTAFSQQCLQAQEKDNHCSEEEGDEKEDEKKGEEDEDQEDEDDEED